MTLRMMTTWRNYPSQPAVTTWNYSSTRGWLDNKRYPDAGSGTLGPDYLYTAAGKLRERTWARGNPRLKTTYAYNIAGDLETIDYADSTPDVTYGFDRRGRQSSVSQNGSAAASSTYNDLGNVLSETNSTGLLSGLSVTNGYDQYLCRTNVVLLGSGSALLASTTNSFDTAGRMKVVASGAAKATYSYLANSPLVEQISFANNGAAIMNTVKSYDALNRLTNIVSTTNGTALSKHGYLYNSANQRTRATLVDSSYWVYTYDSLGQVTSGRRYWSDGTPVAGQQFEYGFDTIGNRKTAASGGDEFGTSLKKSDYFANSLNQYTNRSVPGFVNVIGTANAGATVSLWGDNGSFSPTSRKGDFFRGELAANNATGAVWLTITNVAVLKSGNTDIITNTLGKTFVTKTPQAFYYDSDGNLTNDANWMCTWDAENRLTRMVANTPTGPQQRIDFAYDWQGRRVSKRVWNNTAGTGTLAADLKFVYDGWNLIAELNATNNAVIRSYIWGLDLSGSLQGAGGVGGLLAVNDTVNGRQFPAFDGNGNVAALVAAQSSTVSALYEHGPFGEILRATGPMATINPFRFSTKFQDDETDLIYYGHRLMKATSGNWLSRDPIDELGHRVLLNEKQHKKTRPDQGNLYGFARNNPVDRIDPDGRDDFNSSIEQCNRQIENPSNDFLLGCCNLRGHDFFRWPDGNGGFGSVGLQDPKTKKGGFPEEDHPEQARTCRKCYKTGSELKYGSGKGKSGNSATNAEIQDCLKNRPLKTNWIFLDDYNGLLNNCNTWARWAQGDCGLSCSGNSYLVR